MDIARRVAAAYADLPARTEAVWAFLTLHPDYAPVVERITLSSRYPYPEIHDNLIAKSCLPVDMLRCKLAFFGASKFDRKSDGWTRITLCQGASLADRLGECADDWWLPAFGT